MTTTDAGKRVFNKTWHEAHDAVWESIGASVSRSIKMDVWSHISAAINERGTWVMRGILRESIVNEEDAV